MDANVLVGIPCGSHSISCAVVEDLFEAVKPYDVSVRFSYGYEVDVNRNKLCKAALDGGYSHVLFVDSDVRLPAGALQNLLQWNEGIVFGYYAHHGQSKWDGSTTSLCKPEQIGYSELYTIEELRKMANRGRSKIDIAGGGMGCALISAEVLKKVKTPWFHYRDRRTGDLSEDYWFCSQCKMEGFRIFADLRVACQHGVETWEKLDMDWS